MLSQETFVCLDCESTGLDTSNDRVIEVAAVKFTLKETVDEIATLVDPQCPIPEASFKIHNISDEMCKGQAKISEVLPKVLKFIGKNIIIGHRISFDLDLLSAEAARNGIHHSLSSRKNIDTLRLARLYGESPVNSLEALRQHFNIEDKGAHRAYNDVLVNIEVFKHLIKKYKTTKQLLEISSKPVSLKMMPLGKHKGRLISEIPPSYLKWASHQNFDEDLLFTVRRELKKRNKGNGFSQAANPFSHLT